MPRLVLTSMRVFGDGWTKIGEFEAETFPMVATSRIGTQSNTADHATAELRFRNSAGTVLGSASVVGAVAAASPVTLGIVSGRVTVELRATTARGVAFCEEVSIANQLGEFYGNTENPANAGLDPTALPVGTRYGPTAPTTYGAWVVVNNNGTNVWRPYALLS